MNDHCTIKIDDRCTIKNVKNDDQFAITNVRSPSPGDCLGI